MVTPVLHWELVTPIYIYATITFIIEGSVHFAIALKIWRNRLHQKDDMVYLYKIFFITFLSWAAIGFIATFSYLIAPLSFDPAIPMTRSGFDIEHPSLFIANVLREAEKCFTWVTLIGVLVASYTIRYGSLVASKRILHNKLIMIPAVILFTVANILDNIAVQIQPGGNAIVMLDIGPSTALILGIIMGFYFGAVFHLHKTTSFAPWEAEKTLRKRINLLVAGVLLEVIAYVLTILSFLSVTLQTSTSADASFALFQIILLISVRAIFVLAPVVMYFAFRKSPQQYALEQTSK